MKDSDIYGYHLAEIPKGALGESSKIQEELYELCDAENQDNKILALCELSDIVGAINAYMQRHFPTLNIHDLIKMSEATERAFLIGDRQ